MKRSENFARERAYPMHLSQQGRIFIVIVHYDRSTATRPNGAALPHAIYDRLVDLGQDTVIIDKQLWHALSVSQRMQEQRDSRRGKSAPARTNQGLASVKLKTASGQYGTDYQNSALTISSGMGRPPLKEVLCASTN
ncbi:hypothetical protein [Actimicrobium sp. CCI2.3]|uniref:hypothetical protein n=1 Tax=Actimicrobium sp. CCI2.3 TaxID=3048616 RepID=UPI002AB38743|nr:hypothetical protein [Actimicrobium sp. CCI2.3]MDY7573195.1 hypothetical protein [Actimicrobium sp. CCI2.3]MEB0022174.1 hypothetical protein [Actimicrobium sp. CCI2.3]